MTTSYGPPPIRCAGVVKKFGRKAVLNGVDLDVARGEVVGLLGTNGAGKTTLLQCLVGLLRVADGRCEVLGEDSWDLSEEVKANLGYVPQQVQVYPWMRVGAMLDYIGAFYPNWDRGRTRELAARWQLDLKARAGTLSGGQTQKLGLVMALGHDPDVLILDEPAASLDPLARREFLRSLIDLTAEGDKAILFSTHIVTDLERVATDIAILRGGTIAARRPTEDFKESTKRLRITAARDLPPDLDLPGVLRANVRGKEAVVSVAAVDEGAIAELRMIYDADVYIEDLNLEEIFVELHDDDPVVTGADR